MTHSEVAIRGQKFLSLYSKQSDLWKYSSATVIFLTTCWARSILNLYKVNLHNSENLYNALDLSNKQKRGLITVSNHISVFDDPFMWAFMSTNNPSKLRWILAAEDICFKNRFTSSFFYRGNTLSTKRFGAGPFQPSVDASIYMLSTPGPYKSTLKQPTLTNSNTQILPGIDQPGWVHVFPEGKVHQTNDYSMRYFHWGISRMVLETNNPPIILPIFHTGLDKSMPEDRSWPRFIPRNFGSDLNFYFGSPLPDDTFDNERLSWEKEVHSQNNNNENDANNNILTKGPTQYDFTDLNDELKWGQKSCQLRSNVALKLRSFVDDLRISKGFPPQSPSYALPEYWAKRKGINEKII